jgi:hypothetical protein
MLRRQMSSAINGAEYKTKSYIADDDRNSRKALLRRVVRRWRPWIPSGIAEKCFVLLCLFSIWSFQFQIRYLEEKENTTKNILRCFDDPIHWPPKFITSTNEAVARHFATLGLQDLDKAARKRGTACTSPAHGSHPFLCDTQEDVLTRASGKDEGFMSQKNIYGGISKITGSKCSFCSSSLGGRYFAELARMLSFYAANNGSEGTGCTSLVVFGVAFGQDFFQYLFPKIPAMEEDSGHPLNRNVCFFTFVLEEDLIEMHGVPRHQAKLDKRYLRNPIMSQDRLDILIPISKDSLPYVSMRRNTKLFKMHSPSLLFSFAERVVWQDAKFRRSDFISYRPKDYLDYFDRTVGRTGTCVSLMTLPKHSNTMGAGENCLHRNLFHRHCQTLLDVDAKGKRVGKVTDSRDAIAGQCAYYLGKELAALAIRSGQTVPDVDGLFKVFPEPDSENDFLTLSDGLIDSAFIVWDRRSERCRNFGADLTCTWSDESRCFSDRDQLSFPSALTEMGLRKDCPARHLDSQLSDRIFVHDVFAKGVLEQPFPSSDMQDGTPLVHIVRAECHWYFKSLDDCHTVASNESLRVAIVIAGTFRRLFLESTVKNLVRPLVQQGFTADVFLSITTDQAKAYRSGYMNETTWDPVFGSEFDKDGLVVPTPNSERILYTIRDRTESHCGRLRHVTVQNSVDIDSNSQLQQKRQRMKTMFKGEDPDTRFPVLDLRSPGVIARTIIGNQNLLRLHLSVRGLWEHLLEAEEHDGMQYGHVFFLRDDSWWINDFDFRGLLDKYHKQNIDIYVPSCDARIPPMASSEISDHGLISARTSAELFGRYFDNLLDADLQSCAAQLPEEIVNGGLRGCNSEMILKFLIDKAQLHVAFVGKALLPFQRSVHLKAAKKHGLATCFHKVCQSKEDPLDFGPLKSCNDIF